MRSLLQRVENALKENKIHFSLGCLTNASAYEYDIECEARFENMRIVVIGCVSRDYIITNFNYQIGNEEVGYLCSGLDHVAEEILISSMIQSVRRNRERKVRYQNSLVGITHRLYTLLF
jgi:hypothetical protein